MTDIDELPSDLRDRLLSAALRLADRSDTDEDLLNGLSAVRQALHDHALEAVPSRLNLRAEVERRVEVLERLAADPEPDGPTT